MTREIHDAPTPIHLTARKPHALFLIALATLMLTACSPYATPEHMGNRLSLAGFTAHRADTTARMAQMNLLPPEMLTWRPGPPTLSSATGPAIMLYADPLACGCVYIGDLQAYARYRLAQKAKKGEDGAMRAEIRRDPGWDWSVWNPGADPVEQTRLRWSAANGTGWTQAAGPPT